MAKRKQLITNAALEIGEKLIELHYKKRLTFDEVAKVLEKEGIVSAKTERPYSPMYLKDLYHRIKDKHGARRRQTVKRSVTGQLNIAKQILESDMDAESKVTLVTTIINEMMISPESLTN